MEILKGVTPPTKDLRRRKVTAASQTLRLRLRVSFHIWSEQPARGSHRASCGAPVGVFVDIASACRYTL
ncbi:unnamed protein product [marine sediment metagenome]|uniref:Uncharacterized protein n=1 Tax=marine sediment metagenome TaxID=412755 RepID=X0V8P0_9ZZZZ